METDIASAEKLRIDCAELFNKLIIALSELFGDTSMIRN